LTEQQHLQVLAARIGELLGKLHAANVVHGDLTTSNIMMRLKPSALHLGLPAALPAEAVPVINRQELAAIRLQDDDYSLVRDITPAHACIHRICYCLRFYFSIFVRTIFLLCLNGCGTMYGVRC